ncbi:MAG: rhomboid family intramembrane serine protease, partial [Candidatus Eremiobacteraeota bacterium]|nr:rhomboid family intramembrane serine protease [Candidatus Eremiobacteraeota bacterium]
CCFYSSSGRQSKARSGRCALLFFMACGVVGGASQIVAAPNSHLPEIGASGAIAGVLGGSMVRYPRNRIDPVLPIGCLPRSCACPRSY